MATGDVNELRRRIYKIKREFGWIRGLGDELDALIPFTRRDRSKKAPNARPSRKSANSQSDEEIRKIIRFALDHPTWEHREIGDRFGIDGGRVSDYLGSIRSRRLNRLRDEVAQERGDRQWKYLEKKHERHS